MYFGGPFLFPMYNVDWSNPVVTVRPNGGYQFEYKFIARFASNANITAFAGSNNYPVSEFRPIPIITR
jgi:antibiotic biosynthesis monooxygenase (ABM) superfamily enzyme